MGDKICKSCIHWEGHINFDGTTYDGPCALFDKEDGEGQYASIEVSTNYPEFIEGIFLNTSAEFGCNQLEEEAKND